MVEKCFLLSTISLTHQCKGMSHFKLMPPGVQTEFYLCVSDAWHNSGLTHTGSEKGPLNLQFSVSWSVAHVTNCTTTVGKHNG